MTYPAVRNRARDGWVVLLLLSNAAMPVVRLRFLAPIVLGVVLAGSPVQAAERTFMFTAADVIRMIDEFNADVITRSAELGGAVKLRQGSVSLAGKSCPSLALHLDRHATRLRLLDGTGSAATLAARRPNNQLAAALATMGAATWAPPAQARTHRIAWMVQSSVLGFTGFATEGFASGDSTGGITGLASSDIDASFVVGLDVTTPPSADPAELVVALTTELPRKRPKGKPKRTECYLVTSAHATDLQALQDLLAAAAIPEPSATDLSSILSEAGNWLKQQPPRPDRAALMIKRFGIHVASLSSTTVPADAAEALITRALAVAEALDF